jgi:hypothetical protein
MKGAKMQAKPAAKVKVRESAETHARMPQRRRVRSDRRFGRPHTALTFQCPECRHWHRLTIAELDHVAQLAPDSLAETRAAVRRVLWTARDKKKGA